MTAVYAGLLFILVLLAFITQRKGHGRFRDLSLKEHPLKFMYPLGAKMQELRKKILPRRGEGRVVFLLRGLYVKENVEQEKNLYEVRKNALMLTVLTGFFLTGLLVSIPQSRETNVLFLERAGFGEGTSSYDLLADYRGSENEVRLVVKEQQRTREQILEHFENSYEQIRKTMLGDNPSSEEVTKPLNLIASYEGIDILWDTDDAKTVGFNGEIKKEPEEGTTQVVNLLATFSMDDVTRLYTMPIRLTAGKRDEREKLLAGIYQEIENNSSLYSPRVKLPETVNGYPVRFRLMNGGNGFLFLILAGLFVAAQLLFYDRTLEKQMRKRKEQMMADFSQIVSKLSLLYDAGLSIHGAFERIVKDEESSGEMGFAGREMKLALEKINTGESESRAYAQFGKRCGLYPYIKLGNLLEQNLNKGTKGMKELLQKEVTDSYEERKRLARKKGEEASTKMLFPMVMMLGVVIVIVALPALMTIGI